MLKLNLCGAKAQKVLPLLDAKLCVLTELNL